MEAEPTAIAESATAATRDDLARDAAAAVLAVILALVPAFARPIFHDEAATHYFVADGFSGLLRALLLDIHPPLYFLAMLPVIELFGLTGARVFSAVMGGVAVFLCLRAMPGLLPPGCARLQFARWILATSPFLAFSAYFARYYTLVMVEVAALLLVLAWWRARPARRLAAAAGGLLAVLLLTHYASAAVVWIVAAPLMLDSMRRRGVLRAQFLAFAAPQVAAFAVALPLLLAQLAGAAGERLADAQSASAALSFVRCAAYLFYCLAAGDGLPPWDGVGIMVAGTVLVLAARTVAKVLVRGSAVDRRFAALCFVPILLACLVGAATFPRSSFIFFPPRFAFVLIPWLLFLVAHGEGRGWLRPPLLVLVLLANVVGLTGLLAFGRTTNWAYELPLGTIAQEVRRLESVAAARGAATPVGVWLPTSSFANVRWHLEREGLGPVNSRPDAAAHVVLVESRVEAWPPQRVPGLRAARFPSRPHALIEEVRLLPEDRIVRRFKQAVTGRVALGEKLKLQLWMPTGS